MIFGDRPIFGNKTVVRHLFSGALGVAALYLALSTFKGSTGRSLVFAGVALFLLKGCPMCWTLGLVETIAMAIHKRSERKLNA